MLKSIRRRNKSIRIRSESIWIGTKKGARREKKDEKKNLY
jgi:hypothetical protein